MAEVLDGHLPEFSVIAAQADLLLQDAGRAEGASDVGESYLPPLLFRFGGQLLQHLPGAAPQRQEGDPPLLQPGQVGIGGEGAVKDQLLWYGPGARAPEVDKAQDLLVTLFLAYLGIDIQDQGTGMWRSASRAWKALCTAGAILQCCRTPWPSQRYRTDSGIRTVKWHDFLRSRTELRAHEG